MLDAINEYKKCICLMDFTLERMQGGIDLLHAHIHFQSVFDTCFQVLREVGIS